MPSFDELFALHVEPLLSTPDDYPAAVEQLELLMPRMETSLDRALAYQWLGTMYISLARGALDRGEIEQVKVFFTLVEEFHVKAIEEEPGRMEPRLNLARYYLTFGDNHQGALETLELPEAHLVALNAEGPVAYRHQRLALRGVALAFLGRMDEAAGALDEAYGAAFLEELPPEQIDVSSINYMALRGFRLVPESVNLLVNRLLESGVLDEGSAEDMRARLLG